MSASITGTHTFRRAGPQDAEVLARFAERTFRDAFSTQNSSENMDALCASAYGESIQRREIVDPDRETWLAQRDGSLLAYSMLKRGDTPQCVRGARPVEILRFYVTATAQGTSLATRMMELMLERCRALNGDVAWLGVWEHNPRAIAFYRKHGFEVVGAHIFRVGQDEQNDLLMRRALAPAT
jgi:ribosomal protein S18 acetylase RimI-like enzyme